LFKTKTQNNLVYHTVRPHLFELFSINNSIIFGENTNLQTFCNYHDNGSRWSYWGCL